MTPGAVAWYPSTLGPVVGVVVRADREVVELRVVGAAGRLRVRRGVVREGAP